MPLNVKRTFGAVITTSIILRLAEKAANVLFPPKKDVEGRFTGRSGRTGYDATPRRRCRRALCTAG